MLGPVWVLKIVWPNAHAWIPVSFRDKGQHALHGGVVGVNSLQVFFGGVGELFPFLSMLLDDHSLGLLYQFFPRCSRHVQSQMGCW